jgi:phosphotriesterase-related protein
VKTVHTVLGAVPVSELGITLMHEHLFISFDGAQYDPAAVMNRDEVLEQCVRRMRALKAAGVDTFVDPCPIELGRDVRLMAEISERSELHIICATGFYHEHMGLPPYWRTRTVEEIASLYVDEIERGIAGTPIRAGVIKCATGAPEITPLEKKFLQAASIAQRATGAPIITHTQQGILGPEQQQEFEQHGVPLNRCLIGHCCNNSDPAYHLRVAQGGSYVGFDRVGMTWFNSDAVRADNVVRLKEAGYLAQLMISQDRFCAWRGKPYMPVSPEEAARRARLTAEGDWPPHHTYIMTHFLPMLRERGVSEEEITLLLRENPRRFFEGGELPRVASSSAA